MEALGTLYDLAFTAAPVDLTTAGFTGKRVAMANFEALDFVVQLGAAASGTEDVVLTPQQHIVETSGSPAGLKIRHFYVKSATALAGTETWTQVFNTSDGTDPDATGFSGTINSTITLAGATYAAKQCLVVIPVEATRLTVGSRYVSLNAGDPGSVSRLGAVLSVGHGMHVRRAAANQKATLY